jgi:hypothetical protein
VYHSDVVCRFDTKCNNMSCGYQHPQRTKAEIEFLGEAGAPPALSTSAPTAAAPEEAAEAEVAV